MSFVTNESKRSQKKTVDENGIDPTFSVTQILKGENFISPYMTDTPKDLTANTQPTVHEKIDIMFKGLDEIDLELIRGCRKIC